MVIELSGQYASEPSRLILKFSRFSDEAARGVFQLVVGDWEIKFPCALRVEDLASFVSELRSVHGSLRGTACLTSSIDDAEIRLTAEHTGTGVISIQGCTEGVYMSVPGNPLEHPPAGAGLRMKFGGVLIDQSYIPGMVEKIVQFLEGEQVGQIPPAGDR